MQQKINFVKLLKEYKSGWVAISSDFSTVVFSGKTLKEVRDKAKHIKDKLYFSQLVSPMEISLVQKRQHEYDNSLQSAC